MRKGFKVVVLALLMTILSSGTLCFADTVYTPDNNGKYTVTHSGGSANAGKEFTLMIVREGQPVADNNIIYIDQQTADTSGNVSFTEFKLFEDVAATVYLGVETSDDKIVLGKIEGGKEGGDPQPPAENAKSNLSLTISGGGRIAYNIDGATGTFSNSFTNVPYVQGNSITFTAHPINESYKFLCWTDSNTNRILSFDNEYSFILGYNRAVTAQFIATNDETRHYVMFKDKNSYILSSGRVEHGAAATVPRLPNYYTGYTFLGWDSEFNSVTQDMVITARYTAKNDTYTLDVTGGKIKGTDTSNGAFKYDTKITVVADEAEAGKVFLGWKMAGLDSYVSFDEEYTFYMGMNTSLTAQYGDVAVSKTPVVTLRSGVDTGVVTFLSERNVPEGYTFVEAGVIVTKSSGTSIDESALALGNPSNLSIFHTRKTISTAADGQYQYNVKAASGSLLYGRAYLIYENDTTGEVTTIYSNMTYGIAG